MGRKRKYKKKKQNWFEDVDWSIEPETLREIGAVVFAVLALFLFLAVFGIAGKLGVRVINLFYGWFGVFAYLMFLIFGLVAYYLWNPKKDEIRAVSWIGGVLIFVFFPALISPAGGSIGAGISGLFRNLVGPIATFIILFGATVIGFLLLFNTSLKNLYKSIMGEENEAKVQQVANDTKVSVFTTLKNTFSKDRSEQSTNAQVAGSVGGNEKLAVETVKVDGDWKVPPYDILDISTTKATSGNIAKNVDTIQKTLGDFGIEVTMGDVNIGPTVTQYTFKPVEGVKLSQIVARQNDLALALAAHPVRLEAPIPGKSAVGVEVPNKVPAIVTIREILEAGEFKGAKSKLSIALGRDVAGKPIIIDLKKMPHLLIAGSTGSGKSIAINGLINSFLYQNSPSDLKLILVDPKRVEFTPYNNLPHLLTPVITEPDKTVNALKWAVNEMENRYKMLSDKGCRDISSYNAKFKDEKMPYIVIVIDELADLMMKSGKEVEGLIVRIAQMARAVGMHLVVATQRPSVNVITGLIKANIASRIAFAVTSSVDSRTILDQSGAEKLLGKGDMLYVSPEFGKPKRVQGVLITEKEVKNVTNFLKKEGNASYDDAIANFGNRPAGVPGAENDIDDDLYPEAKELVISVGKASASYMQRRLKIGYARAARLLDLLEEHGVVGPAKGSKPREVLVRGGNTNEFPPDDPRLDG